MQMWNEKCKEEGWPKTAKIGWESFSTYNVFCFDDARQRDLDMCICIICNNWDAKIDHLKKNREDPDFDVEANFEEACDALSDEEFTLDIVVFEEVESRKNGELKKKKFTKSRVYTPTTLKEELKSEQANYL